MKSLSEWEEEWMAMFKLHQANPTPVMLEEWEQEKVHFLKLYNNRNVSITFVEMCTPKFELHICMHSKWLKNKAVDMDNPTNLSQLTNLTHCDDRIFSLETELAGYEILMSLSPLKRKSFWMKYHRRLQDKSGEYSFYAFCLKGYKFDENGNPVIMMVESKRLPKKYQPDKIHYREFSHNLKQKIKEAEPVLKKLSCRELEVLELAYEGFTTDEIALELEISINTVKCFRKRILKKLNVNKMYLAYVIVYK
jgi:predicted DNA-binding protein (UPF0251 family)